MTTHGPGRPPAPSHRAKPTAKARCVVWCPPGTAPEPTLLESLGRRPEFATEVVNSGYEAFALLCQRTTEAKSTGDHAVLLLVDPAKLPGAVRVMESAAIYATSSSTWAFDLAGGGKLRGVTIEDIASLSPSKPPQAWPGTPTTSPTTSPTGKPTNSHTEIKVAGAITGPRATPISATDPGIVSSARVSIDPPQLRLTGGEDHPPAAPEAAPTPASHLLTDEELAMLLASEPDDGGRR